MDLSNFDLFGAGVGWGRVVRVSWGDWEDVGADREYRRRIGLIRRVWWIYFICWGVRGGRLMSWWPNLRAVFFIRMYGLSDRVLWIFDSMFGGNGMVGKSGR